jgi:hypothetical protein
MLKKIYLHEEYFLDIPAQISTTGSKPDRGIYVRLVYGNGETVWLDSKGRMIDNYNWTANLNQMLLSK